MSISFIVLLVFNNIQTATMSSSGSFVTT